MKTIEVNLYEFHELDEKAQQKALIEFADINTDGGGWFEELCEYMQFGEFLEEFPSVKYFKIIEFDLDYYNRTILEVDWKQPAETEEKLEEQDKTEQALREKVYSTLIREYEYLTSEEAIINTIAANDYWFTIDGKFWH